MLDRLIALQEFAIDVSLPPGHLLRDGVNDATACLLARLAVREKFVITSMCMPDVSSHSERNRVRPKLLCLGRTPDSSGVLLAGVFGDRFPLSSRTPGK